MLSQTSSSVSFWTEPEVNLHTLSACACVCISERRHNRVTSMTDLLNINEAHMAIRSVAEPCGVSLYVPSLLLRHIFACMKCACLCLYMCILCCRYEVVYCIFCCRIFSFSKTSKSRQSLEYTVHMGLLCHIWVCLCVWCFTENEGWQDLWKGWDKHSWFTARWRSEHHWGLAALW